jgi:hypothetical protein
MTAVNPPRRRLAAPLLALALAGCATAPGAEAPRADVPRLRLAAQFALENMCSEGQSPPIAIQNPPAGTAGYAIRFTNMSVLLQKPSDWTIATPADPRRIPLGALTPWSGPCAGDFQTFTYRLEVTARGAAGKPLAFGETRMTARSVNKLAQAQWRKAGQSRPELEDEDAATDDEREEMFDRGERAFDPMLSGGYGGSGRNRQLYVPR